MLLINIVIDTLLFGLLIPTLFVIFSRWLDTLFRFPTINNIFLRYAGFLLLLSGAIIVINAYILIVKRGKGYTLELFGFQILPVTQKLVKSGIYAFVRHPMALGYIIVLLGIAFTGGSVSGIFILTPLSLIIGSLYLVYFEEKKLNERFKEEFRHYKSTTDFIIPFFKNIKKRGSK